MRIVNLLGRLTPYEEADRLQRRLHEDIAAGAEDALLFFEAEPTYTAGRATKDRDIVDATLPVIRTDRGGSVTWHGPGQLVCYPIVKLANPGDVISYIRTVEAGLLAAIRDTWGLDVVTVPGRAGIWLLSPGRPDRKICAIGLKVARGATMHGLALNVHPDMTHAFTGIIPCGLDDADVATLAGEGITATLDQAKETVQTHLSQALAPLLERPLTALVETREA
ncbi:MAG: lipoyl(octanoyl) transferase LipB [Actinomycetaceae bacterium]|nr:lipoyl(octanoyl) transferase LipB [Actinomycetaceae bacterium]MDU0970790.1 lipoyl(octanoyl) transferase LipB [Actinomycetaceae bacterium]